MAEKKKAVKPKMCAKCKKAKKWDDLCPRCKKQYSKASFNKKSKK